MNKPELRKKYRAIRKNLQNKSSLDEKISENFFKLGINPNAVGGYMPMEGEVNSLLIMNALLKQGKVIAVPKINGNLLEFTKWTNDLALNKQHNFLYSASDEMVVPDLILVPLLAFNSECFRIGFGGGFYDRTISRLGKKVILVGLAYSEQFCDIQFQDDHDQSMDYIVTQDGLLLKKLEQPL